MQNKNNSQSFDAAQFQTDWDDAVTRVGQETASEQDMREMLTESAGLSVRSGVRVGKAWMTANCTSNCSSQ